MRSRVPVALSVVAAIAATAVAVALLRTPTVASADRAHGPAVWVGAWGADMTAGGRPFQDQTIREVVRPTASGSRIRLHLSNWLGTTPLMLGEVDVAVQASGGSAERGSSHEVMFHGARSVTIPAGDDLTSDAVPMPVNVRENLLVSLFLPGATSESMWHSDAFTTTYVSAPGDHARAATTEAYPDRTRSSYFVDRLDVDSAQAGTTVVTFGDSITDGSGSTFGADQRWPDDLSRLLGPSYGVVDAGIAGNRVLTNTADPGRGVSAEQRFAHDALDVSGVKVVILLEGINDIGSQAGPYGNRLTSADLISGYQDLIEQAHAAHVRIIGGTLLPYQGAPFDSAAGEAIRAQVNAWIRTSGAFDGVIDFAAVMGDHSDPAALDHGYDCGDHLHPNDAGARELASAAEPALRSAFRVAG